MTLLIAFIYFAIVVGVALGAFRIGTRVGTTRAIRARNELPSVLCNCGGEWTNWGRVETAHRPKDPDFPLTGGTIETRLQTRTCQSCGLADVRPLR